MLNTLKDFGYTNEYNSFVRRIAINSRVKSADNYVNVDIRGIAKLESIRSDSSLLTMYDGSTLLIGIEPIKLVGIYKLYNLVLTNQGYKNCFTDKIQFDQLKTNQPSNMLMLTDELRKLVNANLNVCYWLNDTPHLVKLAGEVELTMLETKDVWLMKPHPISHHGLLVFTDKCLHIEMSLKHFLMGVNDQDFVLVKKNTWLRASMVSHLTTYKDDKDGKPYLDINLTNGKFITVSRLNKAAALSHFVNKPVIKL